MEIAKFIVVSVVASNIIAFGFNWIEFIATGNADLFLCAFFRLISFECSSGLSKIWHALSWADGFANCSVGSFHANNSRAPGSGHGCNQDSSQGSLPLRLTQERFDKTYLQSLPMAYLTLSTVLCFVGFQCPWIIIQFGWFVGWIYLRFYKKNAGDSLGGSTYGDRSETFSLISWFPPFMQCVIQSKYLRLNPHTSLAIP